MTRKGEITYSLWTVTGTKELRIRYTITGSVEDGGSGIGELEVQGEGEKPEIDEDTVQEIIMECLKDAKRREELEEKKQDKPEWKMFNQFDIGVN